MGSLLENRVELHGKKENFPLNVTSKPTVGEKYTRKASYDLFFTDITTTKRTRDPRSASVANWIFLEQRLSSCVAPLVLADWSMLDRQSARQEIPLIAKQSYRQLLTRFALEYCRYTLCGLFDSNRIDSATWRAAESVERTQPRFVMLESL